MVQIVYFKMQKNKLKIWLFVLSLLGGG